ncbi:TonB-dependent receptor [Teredinibacter haidensis]|uniref:TonB-dependent receptor n=1 Tax=Teredinibacter haidensis TaxID=2731755 RepID=UPI000948BECD|nr:TonB-dependent receptor [Teredinibacter haidensis]
MNKPSANDAPPNKPLTLRRDNPSFNKTAIALSIPAMLMAAPSLAADDEFVLDTMQIEDRTSDTNPYAEDGAPYKAKVSGDQRRVSDLAKTPQTISVLTQTAIKESGKTDLRDVLAAQPGVTLGTGENGNAFGDRYIIRGHEARSDVFVDGLRDPGMTTRESFAVEQIEITKGPSATFAGRGATGGAVNSITKQASTDYNFNKVEAAIGTDAYRRLSLDSNIKISEELAARVNILHSFEEVPDRAPADRERNGIAASVSHQTTDKLSLVGDFYYLNAKDNPDLGTYIVTNGDPVDELPAYLQDQDFLDSEVQAFTFRAGYDFSENLRLHNATRYGTTSNGYVVTGARGTSRAVDVTDPDTGDVTPGDPDAPGLATVSLSTHEGWQEVDYLVNQTNVLLDTELAGQKHQFVFSAEYSDLSVTNGVYSNENTGAANCVTSGRGGVVPSYCIIDAAGNYITDNGQLMGRSITKGDVDSDYTIKTVSLSVMDTIALNDTFTLHGGFRIDSFDYSNKVVGWGATEATDYSYDSKLWNGHLGLVYTINESGNAYITYGSATNINGGESDVGANCGYGGICTDAENVGEADPETTGNFELGTKWNLNNNKLLLTGAIFQITKSDVMESLPRGSSYSDVGTVNTGKNRVQGFEVSLVGNINEKLSTQLGVTMMESEVLESTNEDSLGKRLSNFADDSAFAQLRYQATKNFAFGGVATYSSELFSGQPDTAAGESYKVPAYTVIDFFASYQFSNDFKAQLNIGNLTDEDYYLAAYRSGSFTYIGDARNIQATLSYDF